MLILLCLDPSPLQATLSSVENAILHVVHIVHECKVKTKYTKYTK